LALLALRSLAGVIHILWSICCSLVAGDIGEQFIGVRVVVEISNGGYENVPLWRVAVMAGAVVDQYGSRWRHALV